MATFGTFTDGSTLKASEMNNMGVWTSFTPVFRQSSSLTLSTAIGFYMKVNKFIYCIVSTTVASSGTLGTAGQRLELDLPVTALTRNIGVIGGGFIGSGGSLNQLSAVQYSTTRAAFIAQVATSPTAYYGTVAGGNQAYRANQTCRLAFMYEAA